eukprot:gb/GEZN01015330.1/.p1 GENE.gb/GEZN01015330.1/~~gb/GEZN01015330.1/.p1  ORF type:complete len:186 (-),score=23.39 gb/GEZN01015330.1/:346-903(-)
MLTLFLLGIRPFSLVSASYHSDSTGKISPNLFLGLSGWCVASSNFYLLGFHIFLTDVLLDAYTSMQQWIDYQAYSAKSWSTSRSTVQDRDPYMDYPVLEPYKEHQYQKPAYKQDDYPDTYPKKQEYSSEYEQADRYKQAYPRYSMEEYPRKEAYQQSYKQHEETSKYSPEHYSEPPAYSQNSWGL